MRKSVNGSCVLLIFVGAQKHSLAMFFAHCRDRRVHHFSKVANNQPMGLLGAFFDDHDLSRAVKFKEDFFIEVTFSCLAINSLHALIIQNKMHISETFLKITITSSK